MSVNLGMHSITCSKVQHSGLPLSGAARTPLSGAALHTVVRCSPHTVVRCSPHTVVRCSPAHRCPVQPCTPLSGAALHTVVRCSPAHRCPVQPCTPLSGAALHTVVRCSPAHRCPVQPCPCTIAAYKWAPSNLCQAVLNSNICMTLLIPQSSNSQFQLNWFEWSFF